MEEASAITVYILEIVLSVFGNSTDSCTASSAPRRGRGVSKRTKMHELLTRGILSVVFGIRSAYLVDATFLNRETLARLVSLLRQHPFPRLARIRGLDIGDGAQSYILEIDALVQKIRLDMETGWSGSESSTYFITVRDGINTIASKDDDTVQSLIRFLSDTILPFETTPLLSVPSADTFSPVALAGYLLDYPFTYTCSNHPLSFEVLHRICVFAFPPPFDHQGRRRGDEAQKERVLVTSFTIPADVMRAANVELEIVISRTKRKFEERMKLQCGWSGLIVETTDVCLPSVTL